MPMTTDDPLAVLEAAVQYRRKSDATDWRIMAAFDRRAAADAYCGQQRTDADWPWEYRVIDLS